MQLTYTLPVDSINEEFLESIKSQFAGKDVKISIEEVESHQSENQILTFQRMEKLRKKLQKLTDLKITLL